MKKIELLFPALFFLFSINSFSQQTSKQQINELIENWHHSASIADSETFFGSMTKDAHYIGTDETEDWLRDEMKEWSKEIFKRESAWDFKTKNRNIYLDEDEKLAWFDETLDTWMGVCRGSGIVVLTEGEWKIKHYVLSVIVPNDLIQEYLKLYE